MTEPSQEQSVRRRGLLFAVVFLLLIGSGIAISKSAARAAPEQPIDFNHQLHDESGIECLFCHPNPMRSDMAGIPSVERCVGCHGIIALDREPIQEVLSYWKNSEPIPWNPVQSQPDHVYFSHQPHILSGLSCETCHGDIANMPVVRPVINMDMGWCLNCHQDQPEDKVARLADCLACHK